MNLENERSDGRYLHQVNEGEMVRIRSIDGGRGVNRRLKELGMSVGTVVKVVQNTGGLVIIVVGDSRMGVGKGVAGKIRVE